MAARIPRPLGPFRLRWRRWGLLTFALWALAVAVTLAEAAIDASAGRAAVEQAVVGLQDEGRTDVSVDEIRGSLTEGRSRLSRSTSRLNSPVLWPLRPLPIVGRQLDSARSLASASSDIVSEADGLVSYLESTDPSEAGDGPIVVLREVDRRMVRLLSVLETQDLGPSEALVGPLERARAELEAQSADLREQTAQASVGLRGLASFLEGGTYLLLGANPAEMRLAGGMPLSIGTLQVQDADLTLTDFRPTHELFPVESVPVLDADVDARWGFLSPSNDYRKLAYSARFGEWVGPQAVAMWRQQSGAEVDGVLQIDPFVLQALLGVVGPVEVDGMVYDRETILDYLLIGQYREFGDTDHGVQAERRDRLADVATAVVEKLDTEPWDPLDLARALRPLVAGRHVLAYSADPEVQNGWDALKMSGRMVGNEVGVFALNLTVGKNDPYLSVSTEVESSRSGETRQVTLAITVTNRAPADLSPFAAGAWQELGLEESGSYIGRLVLYVPGAAREIVVEPSSPFEVFGPDGPLIVIGTRFVVNPGEQRHWRLTFDVPDDLGVLRVVPSTRFPPQEWTVGSSTTQDTVAFDLPL